MRTVPLQDIVYAVARDLGWEPDAAAPSQAQVTGLLRSVNQAVAQGWRWAWWPQTMLCEERTADADGVIALEQEAEEKIGEVKLVAARNPLRSAYAGRLAWHMGPDGIQLSPTAPATVWVYFRKPPPEYAYSAGLADGFPEFLRGFVRHMTVARELSADGQRERKGIEEEQAWMELEGEELRTFEQQGQHERAAVAAY